eukprot:3941441-Rhodomonas_salina.1
MDDTPRQYRAAHSTRVAPYATPSQGLPRSSRSVLPKVWYRIRAATQTALPRSVLREVQYCLHEVRYKHTRSAVTEFRWRT